MATDVPHNRGVAEPNGSQDAYSALVTLVGEGTLTRRVAYLRFPSAKRLRGFIDAVLDGDEDLRQIMGGWSYALVPYMEALELFPRGADFWYEVQIPRTDLVAVCRAVQE